MDDDGQLSHSSQRIREDVSKISSRENRSHQSTPVSIDINEENQLRCNLEQQKSSTGNPIQHIPPRPGRPKLFLQPSTAPKINFARVIGAHQRSTEMQKLEISQQEHNLAGIDNNVHNAFTQAHHILVFNSATDDTQFATISRNNHTSLPPHSLHTAPIILDNSEANENHLINLLPPITNLRISSNSITAKSEYCASNFPKVSITENLISKSVTENRFIFQTPNQACHDTQKDQIPRYNKGKSNSVFQQQSLQAFAPETDCSLSKNFDLGNQEPHSISSKCE